MAFEDDMIEAGYSDEQEYLESLIDDFAENYRRQLERESEYDDDVDSSYYEEMKQEQRERLQKKEKEEQWVNDWKETNPDLAVIWHAYFRAISSYSDPDYESPKEYDKLKEWLNKRERFESERKKEEWQANIQMLFSMYKDELFNSYFPEEEKLINISFVLLQARELQSIEIYEPLLWETVCSSYAVNPKLLEGIEEKLFWEEAYNREMNYEYWKDNNIEQYNQFAKQWIADGSIFLYGEWLYKHKAEGNEWKQKNHNLWNKFKQNYEIREKNKYIESKIDEYKSRGMNENSIIDDNFFGFDDDELDSCKYNAKPFLPDLECTEEIPYDISSLDEELRHFIQDSISSLDISNISVESSRYADKVTTQLWIYIKRDEWEKDALKKDNGHLVSLGNIKYQELLTWWKEKYPTKWNSFIETEVPKFKKNFEIVMKFRLWALDGHKDEFFSIGEKYLSYWSKTLRFMYGQDIYDQIKDYFIFSSNYSIDFWGEPVDCITKFVYTSHEVDIWQKELQDQVIWDVFYNKNYKEHYCIESMYTSLR